MPDTKALHRIGIDTEEGIAYCADDAEFYEDMLREYLQESDDRAADLQRFYAPQRWPSAFWAAPSASGWPISIRKC